MLWKKIERVPRRVEAREPCKRRKPGADGHIDDAEHQEAAENAGDEHPVEHLERTRDAFADQQHTDTGEERDDADQVDVRRVGRPRWLPTRASRSAGSKAPRKTRPRRSCPAGYA